MAENEVLVDIRDLGKREKEVKLFDPYTLDEEKRSYTIVRLVKMTPGESKLCFQASKETYQKELLATKEDEKQNHTFENMVKGMSKEDVVNQLVAMRRVSLEAASDLIEIPDEDSLTEEEIEGKREEKISQWEAEVRKDIESKPEDELKAQLQDILLETPAISAQNRTFAERALCYMCYEKDGDKRLFSSNPEDENYITRVIRDELIFAQLQAAYYDFTSTYRISAKEIRKHTMRGGDFFTSVRSASDTEKSRSTTN